MAVVATSAHQLAKALVQTVRVMALLPNVRHLNRRAKRATLPVNLLGPAHARKRIVQGRRKPLPEPAPRQRSVRTLAQPKCTMSYGIGGIGRSQRRQPPVTSHPSISSLTSLRQVVLATLVLFAPFRGVAEEAAISAICHSWSKCVISHDGHSGHVVLVQPSVDSFQENVESNIVVLTNLRMDIFQAERLEVIEKEGRVQLLMRKPYHVASSFFRSKESHPWWSEVYSLDLDPEDFVIVNGRRTVARALARDKRFASDKERTQLDSTSQETLQGPLK